jgi:alpha-2-macroglobulin-like protein
MMAKFALSRGMIGSSAIGLLCCAVIGAGWARGHRAVAYDPVSSEFNVLPVEMRILGQKTWYRGGPVSTRIVITNHNTAQPVPADVKLQIQPMQGGKASGSAMAVFTGHTNRSGTLDCSFKVPAVPDGSYRLLVSAQTDLGEQSLEEPLTIKQSQEVLFTTDKPVYQPEQTIHMRALGLDMAARHALSGLPATFEVEDGRGNKVFKKEDKLSEYGIASADFTLADEVNMGTYTLRVVVPGTTVEKKVNVSKYVLPKYKTAITLSKPYYLPGEEVRGTVTANYFFGKPLNKASVKLTASTPGIGIEHITDVEGTTDSNGSYSFTFKLPETIVGQPLEQGKGVLLISATLRDTADHQQVVNASAPVVKEPVSVMLVPEHSGLVKDVPNKVYVSAATPDGSPIKGASIHVAFGSVAPNGAWPAQTITSDALGLAEFAFVPNGPNMSISVTCTDSAGKSGSREIMLAESPALEQLILRPERTLARVGERIKLQALSPAAKGTLFLDVIRNKQTILTTACEFARGKAETSLTLTPDMAGTLELHAYRLLPNEQIIRDTRTVLVMGANDLTIQAALDAAEYKPGGTASLQISVTDSQKHPVLAALGLSIVDESVFGLSEMQPGLEKVYFHLEHELMTPRYEIHGLRPTFLLEPNSRPISSDTRQLAAAVLLAKPLMPVAFEVDDNSYHQRWRAVQSRLVERMTSACKAIASAVAKYTKNTGETLSNADTALDTLVSAGYLTRSQTIDPWGTPYRVTLAAQNMQFFFLASAGPDKKWNTADDTNNVSIFGSNQNQLRFRNGFAAQGMIGGGFGGGMDRARMAMGGRAEFDAVSAAAPMSVAKGVMHGAEQNRGTGSGAGEPRVRQYFPETMYWNPAVITDKDGKATLSLNLADNITTWRLSMLGNTAGSLVGSATVPIKVFQDFFVDLDVPVSFTQNDKAEVPVAVYNYLATPQTVNIDLQPEPWYQLDGAARRTVHLAAGEVTSVHYPIKLVGIGKHTLTVTAHGTKLSDAVRRSVEVTPDGKEQVNAVNGMLNGTADRQVTIPEGAIPGSEGLWVKIYPGSFSTLVEGLDGILMMPNGCFEQTSSSTYPNVLALQYLKEVKKANPEVRMKAEQYINIGYQRLVTFECKNGGFSWFGNEPAHQVLTAYGLLEFADMSKVHDVDPAVISRTQNWLVTKQQGNGSWNETGPGIAEGIINRQTGSLRTTAYVAWALSESGYNGPALTRGLNYVVQHASEARDAYTLAIMLNMAVRIDKNSAFASECAERLIALAQTDEKQAYWKSSEMPTFTGGRSAGADTETCGLAAYALTRWGRNSGFTNKALTYLVLTRGAIGTWQSTQGTVWALKALVAATGGTGGVAGTLTIAANGKSAAPIVITEKDSDLMRQIDLRPYMKQGGNAVHLEFKGTGTPQYQIVSRSYLPWNRESPVAPAFAPLSIAVNYDKTTMALNDTAGVTVVVHNNTERIADMPLVDIGIPPGFMVETDNLDAMVKANKISKYKVAGRQLIIYLEKLGPTETLEVKYRIRAQYPIKAKTPLTKVYPYYDPAKIAFSKPQALTVTR